MKPKKFKNLATLKDYFTSEDKCRKYLELARWGKSGIGCPHCGSTSYYILKDGKNYKCKDCKKKFNVLTKTVMENTKISLVVWFQAMYIMTSHKKGISSIQLGKDLGIAQKNAWYLAHRIRAMVSNGKREEMSGTVECDSAFMGGKYENMHEKERNELKSAGVDNKTEVFGMVQRGGKLLTYVMKPEDNGDKIKKIILDNIEEKKTKFYTDGAMMYRTLDGEVQEFGVVQHSIQEYVVGEVHTNSIESFWSMLKRGIYGIYHSVSPKHLQRYCHEFEFRHNTKHMTEVGRFNTALMQLDNTKLGYIPLINTLGSVKRSIKVEPNPTRQQRYKRLNTGESGNLL